MHWERHHLFLDNIHSAYKTFIISNVNLSAFQLFPSRTTQAPSFYKRSSIMRGLFSVVAILGLNRAFALASLYRDPAPLQFEHPGDLFNAVTGGSCCVDGVISGANSTGETKSVGGGEYSPKIPFSLAILQILTKLQSICILLHLQAKRLMLQSCI
jgi:hypothetical protein